MRIGIDVGGTFTDVVLIDPDSGAVTSAKVATTPQDPVEGALAGIREVLRRAAKRPQDVRFVGHGTTIATNLVVEGKGAPAALIATRGFRDLLEIRRASRHDRADLYDLFFDNPAPLVPRRRRFEVAERVRYDGSVECELTDDELRQVIEAVRASGAEAVAVCLINSHVNPEHEQRIVSAIRTQLPRLFACASFEVNPEILEYERTSTTVMNAVLGPRCARYIRTFESRLKELGTAAEVPTRSSRS